MARSRPAAAMPDVVKRAAWIFRVGDRRWLASRNALSAADRE